MRDGGGRNYVRLMSQPRTFQPKEKNFGSEGVYCPEWIRDAAADEKLGGPRRDRKNPVCPKCYMRTATNGACGC